MFRQSVGLGLAEDVRELAVFLRQTGEVRRRLIGDGAKTEADIAERLNIKLSEPWSLQARAKAAAPIRETEGIGVGSEGTGSGSVVGSSGGDVGGVTGRSAGVFRKWMLCVFQSIPGL